MIKQVGKLKVDKPSSPSPQPPQNGKLTGILLVLVALTLFVLMGQKDFIIWKDGKPELAPWRKAKLEKELKEIDNAEQYALTAQLDGYYPCYNCGQEKRIFLKKGEVWKYGHTRKGEKGRYRNWHRENNLQYVIQFEGTSSECAKEEKKNIYYYPSLPENLAREHPLKRPPGNKKDS